MKSLIIKISIILLLVSCKNNLDNSSSDFKDIFINEREIHLRNIDSLKIIQPYNVIVNNKNQIIWCDLKMPIYFFDFYGNLVKTYNKVGNGPGEVKNTPILKQDKRGIYYLFNKAKQSITILDDNLNYKYNFFIKNANHAKNVAISNEGGIIIQREASLGSMKPAILKYNKDGGLEGEWGKIPYIAFTQETLDGGGIVTDLQGNIFYSYLSDYKLYKIDIKDSLLTILDNKPSYFIEAKKNKINLKDYTSTIKYVFKTSRIQGLFFVEPNIIIQQVIQGVKNKTQVFLEIWRTSGEKIYSGVKSPGIIIGSFRDNIMLIKLGKDYRDYKKNLSDILILKYINN